MTTEEATYIMEKWYPIRDGAFYNPTIGIWNEAERILRGWDKPQPRSCSCEYKTQARMVKSFFSQYETQIRELYGKTSV